MIEHTMKNLLLFIFILSYGHLFSQKSYPENYAPKSILDAINYMDYKWSDQEKKNFKNKEESNAVSYLHFGYGMWLRNNWLRHGNPKLHKCFYKRKVFHIDDMSSIILRAFHRKLNNKDLGLTKIFKTYRIQWQEGKEGRKKYSDSISKVFENYKVNDTISWKYYTTVIGVSPEQTEMYGDCKPKAVILKKKKKNTTFLVKLISCCNGKDVEIMSPRENTDLRKIEINKTGWTYYWEWDIN